MAHANKKQHYIAIFDFSHSALCSSPIFLYFCPLTTERIIMYRKYLQSTVILVTIAIAAMLQSCDKEEPTPYDNKTKRTILVYMLADNNLGSTYHFDDENINAISRAIGEKGIDGRMLILYNSKDKAPVLQEIVRTGQGSTRIDTLKLYSADFDPTEMTSMSEIMEDATTLAPAHSYGLIMWSHATGWLPNNHYYAPQRAEATPTSFGREGDEKAHIEVDEIADALAPFHFDLILFDACLMGNVETAYELRNVSDYVIATATETMGAGFPYYNITHKLYEDVIDYEGICKSYYNMYISNNSSYPHKYGTISLIKTSELERVAEACHNIIAQADNSNGYNAQGIQYFDSTNPHIYYDLEHFMSQYCDEEKLAQLQDALKATVLYKANSTYFISIRINRHCGLSCYIPGIANETVEEYYKSLEWYNRVYQ